jgi:hypothetical protein
MLAFNYPIYSLIKMKQLPKFKQVVTVVRDNGYLVLTSKTDADWFKSYHVIFLATRRKNVNRTMLRQHEQKYEFQNRLNVIQQECKTGNSP